MFKEILNETLHVRDFTNGIQLPISSLSIGSSHSSSLPTFSPPTNMLLSMFLTPYYTINGNKHFIKSE